MQTSQFTFHLDLQTSTLFFLPLKVKHILISNEILFLTDQWHIVFETNFL